MEMYLVKLCSELKYLIGSKYPFIGAVSIMWFLQLIKI